MEFNRLLGQGTHSIPDPKIASHVLFALGSEQKSITYTLAENFEELKKEYDYTCLTCGAKEGEKHRLYKSEFVKLQRGHKDPEKSLSISNIIPQCQFCNRSYKMILPLMIKAGLERLLLHLQ